MPLRRPRFVALTIALLLALIPSSALAYQAPGHTYRASVGLEGLQLDGQSGRPDISADGRYFAFGSTATNASDLDGPFQDVYLLDRSTDSLELLSLGHDGSPARGESGWPRISDDGGTVAFSSSAPNLVEGDANGATDIFVWLRETGQLRRVSINSAGDGFNDSSQNAQVSADGRFVTFSSRATNAVSNPTAERLIFVHDLKTGTTETATHTHDGSAPQGASFFSVLSGDGRYVAYESQANNITPNDGNRWTDCFVYDRFTGETQLVSLTHSGGTANGSVSNVSISDDGKYVAFQSEGTNMVPDITTVLASHIYVRDLTTGDLERVSITSYGEEPAGSSTTVELSHNGRYVMFSSRSDDLVPNDHNATRYDAFIHDRMFGSTELLSTALDGNSGNGHTFGTAMTNDSRYPALYSTASDLVAGDTNYEGDAFIRDRGPTTGPFDLEVTPGETTFVEAPARLGPQELARMEAGPALPLGEADIRHASVSIRPEQQDLYLDLDVGSMQSLRAVGPGLIYGFDLRSEDGRFLHVRAQGRRAAVPPDIGLFDCSGPTCERLETLRGGVGVTGSEVVVSLPLDSLEGLSTFSSVTAWIAPGDQLMPSLAPLRQVDLGPLRVPSTTSSVAIAPAGRPMDEAAASSPATLEEGMLSGALDTTELPDGLYDVWAKVCVGASCGTAVTSIALGSGTPAPVTTELLLYVTRSKGDVVVTAALTDETGLPIEGRAIDFYLNDISQGSAITGPDGTAELSMHRNVAKNGDIVSALFAGDGSYASSTTQAVIAP